MKDRLKEKLRNGDGLTIADRLDIAGEVAALTADKDRLIRRLERRNRWVRIQKERVCVLKRQRDELMEALKLATEHLRLIHKAVGPAAQGPNSPQVCTFMTFGAWREAYDAINRIEGRQP